MFIDAVKTDRVWPVSIVRFIVDSRYLLFVICYLLFVICSVARYHLRRPPLRDRNQGLCFHRRLQQTLLRFGAGILRQSRCRQIRQRRRMRHRPYQSRRGRYSQTSSPPTDPPSSVGPFQCPNIPPVNRIPGSFFPPDPTPAEDHSLSPTRTRTPARIVLSRFFLPRNLPRMTQSRSTISMPTTWHIHPPVSFFTTAYASPSSPIVRRRLPPDALTFFLAIPLCLLPPVVFFTMIDEDDSE